MSAKPPTALSIVRCPRCGEQLGVRTEDVGKKARCRECGGVFRLGRAASEGADRPGASTAPPPGDEPPAAPPPAVVSFACELCQTRLTTAAANVGRRLACPDCGRQNIVPAPAAPKPTLPPPAMEGAQYGVWGIDQEPDAARLNQLNAHLHPVVCELCQTLVYATDQQVGKKIKCPDCDHLNLVHARQPQKPKGPVLVPDGEEYQLDESSAPTPRPPVVPITERMAQLRQQQADERRQHDGPSEPGGASRAQTTPQPTAPERAAGAPPQAQQPPREHGLSRPRRPLVPLVQGVSRMLVTSEIALRWAAQSLVLTVILRMGLGIFNAMGPQALFVLPVFAGACFVGGAWLLSTLPLWLAIVVESSEGNDRLEDPPNWMSFDVAESAFIALSMAAAAVLAWATTFATAALDPPVQWGVAAGTWLVGFAVALLSALEQGSAFAVVSPRVAYSLFRCFGPWLLFTVEVLALAAALACGAWWLVGRWPALSFLLPWLATASVLVYMRLVGRLAWWLADAMPPPDA
ncbi:MAG: hypothetical protein DCC67_20355 [Planctomycetota bacterium]|nr:MAG: hypothetical protein DCC67_20355 [Planctomycetota bacterium]